MLPSAVLGQAYFQCFLSPDHAAFNLVIFRQPPIGDEQIQRGKPAASGHDLLLAGWLVFLELRGDDKVVDQSLRCNQGSQFLDAGSLLLPDIQWRDDKVFYRNADKGGFDGFHHDSPEMVKALIKKSRCFSHRHWHQYSLGKSKVVTLRSASVMIQSVFSPKPLQGWVSSIA